MQTAANTAPLASRGPPQTRLSNAAGRTNAQSTFTGNGPADTSTNSHPVAADRRLSLRRLFHRNGARS